MIKKIKQSAIMVKAVKTFGKRNQEDIAIEEMSELIKALIKHRRYNSTETKENVREEIVDVYIMLLQLVDIHGFDKEIYEQKIERLKQRIESEGQGNA